jgi:DNA-binding MarR family transcriptional regulator
MASAHELAELDHLLGQLALLVWNAVREKGVGGLSLIQLQVLKRLMAEGLRASDLSAGLGVSPAAITKLVDVLAERGLISRTRSLKDRRSTLLEITPAGKAALEKSRRSRARTIRRLLDPLSDEETAILCRIMRRSVDLLPTVWQD